MLEGQERGLDELEQGLLYRKCLRESLAAEEDARDRFWKAMNDQIRSMDFYRVYGRELLKMSEQGSNRLKVLFGDGCASGIL